ncbi:subunit length determinant protein [Flavobacterium cutihirudinis]|uniref:Subunit length determinant protein n=1 Tax=Flavobacterium cutihirudinis TaxID=1265740 RepID=A0A3D9FKA4_9FLAO|nr:lipopolysaccharide biosynthesis protein [Flavobacterium cutihirudinis]RED19615.1 subunit length determinant protein [Flavobacterium cutihirudinis]
MSDKTVKNEEISFKEIISQAKKWLAYLLSQWKIICIGGLIGAFLGIGYSIIKKPVYKAYLSFALEDEKGGGVGGALGLASTLGLDLGGSSGGMFAGANLTELFKSRSMVEKTLLAPVLLDGKKISLAEMYIQNNEWRENWSKKPELKNIQFLPDENRKGFTRVHDSILGSIYGKLSKDGLKVGQRDKKISIVTMEVTSTNELFAKYFCEALAKEVGKFYIDTKSKKARINMNILEHQVDSIRSELNGAITGVALANDNTFNLNPALNIRRAPSSRRQVDVQANTAILTELVKQTELAKVTLRRETPLIQIIDRPILPLTKERFGKAKGIIIGGFLFGFLTVLGLVVRKVFKEMDL